MCTSFPLSSYLTTRERYERVLTDMCTFQDELILQIVQALQDQLAEGAPARV